MESLLISLTSLKDDQIKNAIAVLPILRDLWNDSDTIISLLVSADKAKIHKVEALCKKLGRGYTRYQGSQKLISLDP